MTMNSDAEVIRHGAEKLKREAEAAKPSDRIPGTILPRDPKTILWFGICPDGDGYNPPGEVRYVWDEAAELPRAGMPLALEYDQEDMDCRGEKHEAVPITIRVNSAVVIAVSVEREAKSDETGNQ